MVIPFGCRKSGAWEHEPQSGSQFKSAIDRCACSINKLLINIRHLQFHNVSLAFSFFLISLLISAIFCYVQVTGSASFIPVYISSYSPDSST